MCVWVWSLWGSTYLRSYNLQTETVFLLPWIWMTFIYFPCLIAKSAAAAKSLQSCPTLSDPIDSSPTGSPIPGILQARTLEWVAISFSNT